MARNATMRLEVVLVCEETATTPGGAGDEVSKLTHKILFSKQMTSGTTDGTMIDRVWSSSASVTTSPTDVDLLSTAGLLSKLDGSVNNSFVDLCLIAVANDSTSGDIQVGAGSNPVAGWVLAAGDGVNVKPGGLLLWLAPDGIAPTATTADILRLVASAGTVAGRLILAGRSA